MSHPACHGSAAFASKTGEAAAFWPILRGFSLRYSLRCRDQDIAWSFCRLAKGQR